MQLKIRYLRTFCAEKYSRQLTELCLRYIYYDGTLFIHSLLCLPLCFFLHLILSFCLTYFVIYFYPLSLYLIFVLLVSYSLNFPSAYS
jgi:hypothetical protein